MKKLMMTLLVVTAAATLFGAPKKKVQAMAGNEDGPVTQGREAMVKIDQPPQLGSQCCLMAPSVQGQSVLPQCYTKPRKWIVIETKYTTYAQFLDQLTFNWHVMLDVQNAKENKGNRMKVSKYSYFTCSTTYFNIPQGGHAACVCLPPSYLELYGEPKAIGLEISNQNGDILAGGTWSNIQAIKPDTKFWENQQLMGSTDPKTGKPWVERRQGLVDRSKTIWALVNPNDYEATFQ